MGVISKTLNAGLGALKFDARTVGLLKFDLVRLRARIARRRTGKGIPKSSKLHIGCGGRKVKGWINSDVSGSEFDMDIQTLPLPLPDGSMTDIVSQQVIEHVEYDPALIGLLGELFRIAKPGARVWLSCPDLELICNAYVKDRCVTLDKGQKRHWPHANAPGFPVQHRINFYFHQWGEHKNLYDFEMLDWALRHAGFTGIRRFTEDEFYSEYPEFPRRHPAEALDSLLVAATKPKGAGSI